MEKTKKTLTVGLMVALISLIASPAFARSISLKGAGTALWIFIIIGAIIVLLQLIPAAILFFSFVGTTTPMAFKEGKRGEEGVVLRGAEPVVVKK
jgi:membrane associated rhomboid family serine protease